MKRRDIMSLIKWKIYCKLRCHLDEIERKSVEEIECLLENWKNKWIRRKT
jgi:hypothetical protein